LKEVGGELFKGKWWMAFVYLKNRKSITSIFLLKANGTVIVVQPSGTRTTVLSRFRKITNILITRNTFL